MAFEIVIEGPQTLISELHRSVPGSAFAEKPPAPFADENRDWAKITVLETDEDRLNARLIELSDRISGAERGAGLPRNTIEIRVRNLAYSEPYTGSGEFAEPFDPIPSLTVQPWRPGIEEPAGSRVMILDAPHAFGTGKHPTTRLCLRFLEKMAGAEAEGSGLHDMRVLDFGCGTGILAMAAVKMGAARAVGVEIDPDAAAAAGRNAALNRLADRVEIRQGSWEAAPELFDLIVANVVAGVLFKVAGEIPAHLSRRGRAVVSGCGERQGEEVARLLEGCGMLRCEKITLEKWCALSFVKSNGSGTPAS
jgi:ribosomal protein L11 methyltransferase